MHQYFPVIMGWTNVIIVVAKSKSAYNKRWLHNWHMLQTLPSVSAEVMFWGAANQAEPPSLQTSLPTNSEGIWGTKREQCAGDILLPPPYITQWKGNVPSSRTRSLHVHWELVEKKRSVATSQETQLYPKGLAEKYAVIVLPRATCTVTISDGDFPD